MVAEFSPDGFKFKEDDKIPERGEQDILSLVVVDRTKFQVYGHDSFSGENYPLALNVDTINEASVLAAARNAYLDEKMSQAGDLRDRVYIQHPTKV